MWQSKAELFAQQDGRYAVDAREASHLGRGAAHHGGHPRERRRHSGRWNGIRKNNSGKICAGNLTQVELLFFCFLRNLRSYFCIHVFLLTVPQMVWLGFFLLTPLPRPGFELLSVQFHLFWGTLKQLTHWATSAMGSKTTLTSYVTVEDILVENIIGQNRENYWSKTNDQKDSQNSRYLSKVKYISRNILVEFACTLHPNTFPEKANPFFLMIF